MVTDKRVKVSLAELETHWSYDDAVTAHHILDELDRAEAKAYRMARARNGT